MLKCCKCWFISTEGKFNMEYYSLKKWKLVFHNAQDTAKTMEPVVDVNQKVSEILVLPQSLLPAPRNIGRGAVCIPQSLCG